jgi:GNAT superfamily N-acetyltransferase
VTCDDLGVPVVRRAVPEDAARCAEIVRGLPDFFSEEVVEKVASDLRAHGGWIAVEPAAGLAVGFAVVARRPPGSAEILWMAVDAERRGRGVGAVLLDRLLDDLAAEGVDLVEAKTLDRSAGYAPYAATRRFWEGRGFLQVDTIDPLPGWQPGNPGAIYVAALRATRPSRR